MLTTSPGVHKNLSFPEHNSIQSVFPKKSHEKRGSSSSHIQLHFPGWEVQLGKGLSSTTWSHTSLGRVISKDQVSATQKTLNRMSMDDSVRYSS